MVEEFELEGEAFRAGRGLARVVVTRRGERREIRVPLVGTGGYGYREDWIGHPSSIQFVEIWDDELRGELERLARGAADVEVGRRDRRWRPAPIDLRLEGPRAGIENVIECALDRPLVPYGAVETVQFGVRHEDL